MGNTNINDIINGCLQNDRAYQKILYDMFNKKMYAICLRYTKNRDEANDVLQDSFIKVFNNIHNFSTENSLEGWIKKIVINTSITNYNKNIKSNNVCLDSVDESNIKQHGLNDSDFNLDELLSVLNSLPDKSKLVFNLYAIDGYKHKEIAEILGIDVSTSKSQYSRVRKTIQKKLVEINKEKYHGIS